QAAIDALIQGIAAQPSQLPNWDKLAIAGARNGMPLKRLGLVRKASATVDPASGKPTINLDPSAVKNKQDGALWLMIGMSDMLRLTDAATAAKGQPDASPFQRELASWRDAFKTSAELEAKSGELLVDPALATMQMLYRENQLEAGLLLLAYKESWRPDLEAWKKANPDGVQRFIKSYGLRP
ncbi:MAG: hypothetical protein ABIT83_10565, partial [Massilia sp.]